MRTVICFTKCTNDKNDIFVVINHECADILTGQHCVFFWYFWMESTPCITLSEDESKDDVIMMSILLEPSLMFIGVLDFLELPISALC